MLPGASVIEFPSLKKTRRYGAKVRSGCITCKRRRVRCDEGKPLCSRCTTAGKVCEGYAPDKLVQPKAAGPGQLSLSGSTTVMLLGPEAADKSVHYLDFYHHFVGKAVSSKFDNGFWSKDVLQVAQSESSVRHALVALGYLYETEPGNLKHTQLAVNTQRGPLFTHYNKAVRCLVDRMSEASYSPEVGLIACLLFICIEFLRGNYHTALMHFKNGLNLISDWRRRQGTLQQQGNLHDMPDDIPLMQLFETNSSNTLACSTMMEKNIIPMFARTMATVLLSVEGVMHVIGYEHLPNLPMPRPEPCSQHAFKTVHEAKSANISIRNASTLFAHKMGHKLFERYTATADDVETQMHLLECHRSWFRALENLEREKELAEEDKTLSSALKVGYHTTIVALSTVTSLLQTSYDAYLPHFYAIIHHAKIVMASMGLFPPSNNTPTSASSSPTSSSTSISPSFSSSSSPKGRPTAANFTFEISLIPSIHFVATRCRCPVTRREALSLLALNPPREAIWDAQQHHAISKRVIEIEEREVDAETGWPLESARVCSVGYDGRIVDQEGGFWVNFTSPGWLEGKGIRSEDERLRGPDVQWEERLVI